MFAIYPSPSYSGFPSLSAHRAISLLLGWLLSMTFAPFRPRDRQGRGVEQPDLNEDGSLVPVDMLMNQLVAFELDDADGWDLDYPSGRGTPARSQSISVV